MNLHPSAVHRRGRAARLAAAATAQDLSNGADNFYASDRVNLIPFGRLTLFFSQHLR